MSKGWFRESKRHSLAAKGRKTGRKSPYKKPSRKMSKEERRDMDIAAIESMYKVAHPNMRPFLKLRHDKLSNEKKEEELVKRYSGYEAAGELFDMKMEKLENKIESMNKYYEEEKKRQRTRERELQKELKEKKLEEPTKAYEDYGGEDYEDTSKYSFTTHASRKSSKDPQASYDGDMPSIFGEFGIVEPTKTGLEIEKMVAEIKKAKKKNIRIKDLEDKTSHPPPYSNYWRKLERQQKADEIKNEEKRVKNLAKSKDMSAATFKELEDVKMFEKVVKAKKKDKENFSKNRGEEVDVAFGPKGVLPGKKPIPWNIKRTDEIKRLEEELDVEHRDDAWHV